MPKSKHWTVKTFSINVAELKTTWKDIVEIAQRENVSVSSIIVKALRDYAEEHAPGNPQTDLNSYQEGGAQTLHQLVGQVRQLFYKRGKATRKEVLDYLKEEGIQGPERVAIAKGIIKWLKDKGVKVW